MLTSMNQEKSESYLAVLCNKAKVSLHKKNKENHSKMHGIYQEAFANYSYRTTKRQVLFNLLNTTHHKIITQSDKSECPQDNPRTLYVGSAAVKQ